MGVSFIGDFIFTYSDDNKLLANIAAEAAVLERMNRHGQLMNCLGKESEYVTRGSVLWCTGGTRLTALDIPFDHAVTSNRAAVGICSDCSATSNIYTFGGCKFPSPEGNLKRVSIIEDKTPSRIYEMEKCIPMLEKSWQTTDKVNLKIWDYRDKQYYDVITTGSYLTCFYGGIIRVLEVPHIVYPKDYVREESRDINCYGYAFDLDRFSAPGDYTPIQEGYYQSGVQYTPEQLTEYVLGDMRVLGKTVRVIDSPSKRYPDEYVVAMKTSTISDRGIYDFHFARQLSDGKWADKPGETWSRYDYIDGTAATWDMYDGDKYYNTKSVYFAVKQNQMEQ